MASPILLLDSIVKKFHPGTQDEKTALSGLSLSVMPRDFITLIGSNGAGKTTLLNVIAGVFSPDGGRITINGQDVTRDKEHQMARLLARVQQNPTQGTSGNLTIEENLCRAETRGRPRGLKWGVTRQRKKRYKEVLSGLDLGLENRLGDRVGLLSGGQRQALSLVMTTLNPPQLLLLDEHTAALDPKTADTVMGLTDRMIREHRLTTIMVTHNMNQALEYGNRLVMLHQGRIQLDVHGPEKTALTVAEVIERFGQTLKDESLLSVPSRASGPTP